ncbi:MAG: LptF/LptG family permease, partial [Treponemataceae bacterium]|nr:LptF/LptG family permease [Treponemataceae bacterium]
LAIPLSLLSGKHNGQTIGLIIGLFISVAYWAMMILGQIFGSRSGTNGVILMWLPNIVIGGAALFFYTQLGRR